MIPPLDPEGARVAPGADQGPARKRGAGPRNSLREKARAAIDQDLGLDIDFKWTDNAATLTVTKADDGWWDVNWHILNEWYLAQAPTKSEAMTKARRSLEPSS